METIVATLLTLNGAAVGWGLFLAYKAGRILTALDLRLDSQAAVIRKLDHRLTVVERRPTSPPVST